MTKNFASALGIVFFAVSFNAAAVTLIKPAEAKLPAASGSLATRGITRGPTIKQLSPDPSDAVKSPFNLKVALEARGGATIDPSTIKVTYLKAPAVDLTDRLKPALNASGIDMANAEVPPGEHQLNISVSDSEGRQSNSVITLKVSQ